MNRLESLVPDPHLPLALFSQKYLLHFFIPLLFIFLFECIDLLVFMQIFLNQTFHSCDYISLHPISM